MRRLVSSAWWAGHWPITLVYVFVCAVFVFTVSATNRLRDEDVAQAYQQAVALRDSAVRGCEASNERTAVLRDFVLAVSQDPDPRQFDFIVDPALRAGALEQSRRARADMRGRVARVFVLRDCDAEYPPPPPPADR